MEEEIRRLADELALNGTVVVAGYREDAPAVASVFDLFALPSVHEGLSIALIEAMALGKPAVVSNVGGLPEVVRHGVEGLLVPPADPVALADGIVRLLSDATVRARMGAAAKARAASFDIRGAVRRWEEIYREVSA